MLYATEVGLGRIRKQVLPSRKSLIQCPEQLGLVNTQVRELLFEGTHCVGVKAVVDGREREFRGREIVLSCGAIHSPAHLLRAGIGAVGHLKDMGIPVLMGLEGVGQRLMDHPSISLVSM
jgi:5-(hydroxymethyl)furfural/furfural oxidase